MRKKYIFLPLLAILTAIPFQTIYASDDGNNVGDIHIRDYPKIEAPKTAVDVEKIKKREMDEAKTHVGNIQIVQDVLREQKKHKVEDSKEIRGLKEHLFDAIELGNKKHYDQSVMLMDALIRQHPESLTLHKWAAVYANLAGDYDDSNYRFDMLRLQFPLSKEKIDNDWMIRYYELDNKRNSAYHDKEKLLQNIANEQKRIQRTPNTSFKNFMGISEKDIMLFLMDYQKFLVISNNGADIESADIDALWSRLAKNKQTSLDDFYGFNIDHLLYLYAIHYKRKDLMEVYLNHNAETTNQDIIKKTKTIKSFLAKQN